MQALNNARASVAVLAVQVKVARTAIKQALTWNEDDDIGVSKAAALRIVVLEGKRALGWTHQPLRAGGRSRCSVCGDKGRWVL
jgi:hypothetical protein